MALPAFAIRELPGLFDRERFGLNVSVGVAYLVADVLTSYSWMVPSLLRGDGVGFGPPALVALTLARGALEAVLFVVVVHRARETVTMVVMWGMAVALAGTLWRVGFHAIATEGWIARPILDPLALLSGFLYGAVMLYGIAWGMRRWGARTTAFTVGAAAAHVAHGVVLQIIWAATSTDIRFGLEGVISASMNGAANGLIFGGILFAGVARHLRLHGAPEAPRSAPARVGATPVAKAPGAAPAAPPDSSPPVTQHYFLCGADGDEGGRFVSGCESRRVPVGPAPARRLRARVFEGRFEGALRGALTGEAPFPGTELIGDRSRATKALSDVLRQLQAGQSEGGVNVLYLVTTSHHADAVRQAYRGLEAASRGGAMPLRMYVTESEEAAGALLAALDEA